MQKNDKLQKNKRKQKRRQKKCGAMSVILSSRAKSGYKNVIYDGRANARKKPWSVSLPSYRSAGFATPLEAAMHAAQARLQKRQKPSKPKQGPIGAGDTSPGLIAVAPVCAQAAWMQKPTVNFNTEACDLFGQRIIFTRGRVERMAVIKSWMPCDSAPFGVVFDDKPGVVVREDLMRKGRKDWRTCDWEDDIWETAHLRPMCPQCAHPMGSGRDAWTRCTHCGHMEPGSSSSSTLPRLNTDDPHRRAVQDAVRKRAI